MQNSIWKLTALAGVVGVGFLVVLQAQRGMRSPGEDLASQVQADAAAAAGLESSDGSSGAPAADLGQATVPEQFEPEYDAQPVAMTDGDDHAVPPPFEQEPADHQHVHNASHDDYQDIPQGFPPSGDASSTGVSTAAAEFDAEPQAIPQQTEPQPIPEPADETTSNPFGQFGTPETAAPDLGTETEANVSVDATAGAAAVSDNPFAEFEQSNASAPPADDMANPAGSSGEVEAANAFVVDNPPPAIRQASHEGESAATANPFGPTEPVLADESETVVDDESETVVDDESDDEAGPHLVGPSPFAANDTEIVEVSAEDEAELEFDNMAAETDENAVDSQDMIPVDATRPSPELVNTNDLAAEEADESADMAAKTGGFVPDPSAFDSTGLDEPESEPADFATTDQESQSDAPDFGDTAANGAAPSFAEDFGTEDSGEMASDTGADLGAGDSFPALTGDPSEPVDAPQPIEQAPPGEATADSTEVEPARLDPPSQAEEIPDLAGSDPESLADTNADNADTHPQLDIEKLAPPKAVLGQPLVYHITVTNVGTGTAHEVTVEDRVPEGAELTGTIPRALMKENKLIWKLGDIAAGETKKISIRVTPRQPGRIGSVATVNFRSEVAAQTLITAPELALDLSGPSEAKMGQPVQFSFTVTNKGAGPAEKVIIRDILPAGFSHPNGDDLEYEVGTLPPGESKTVRLTLTAAQVGDVVNHAVVTAEGGVKVESKAPVKVVGSSLVVTRTGPEHRYVGRTAEYSNMVTNESELPVDGATLVETLPPGMEFVEATDNGQYNAGNRTVAWRFDQLGPGQSKVVKVRLRATEPGSHVSQVKAVEVSGNAVEAKSQTKVEGFATLGLNIPPVEGPLSVGEPVAFRIAARNRGNLPATNVRLTLTVPDQLEVVSTKSPVSHKVSGNTLQFAPLARIAGDQQVDFEVVLRARKPGDARLGVQIQADQMQQPLSRQEPILIFSARQ